MKERVEAPRDQDPSSFTPILRRVWAESPAVLAVAFVDALGECIDYCCSINAYDAKVIGAHMIVVLAAARESMDRIGHGAVRSVDTYGTKREILVRGVTSEYSLVLAVETGGSTRALLHAIESAVDALRAECGEEAPVWEADKEAEPLHVELRSSRGWPFAPRAFQHRGTRTLITAVLGRWQEGGDDVTHFRVRTERGEELTLHHNPRDGRWRRG